MEVDFNLWSEKLLVEILIIIVIFQLFLFYIWIFVKFFSQLVKINFILRCNMYDLFYFCSFCITLKSRIGYFTIGCVWYIYISYILYLFTYCIIHMIYIYIYIYHMTRLFFHLFVFLVYFFWIQLVYLLNKFEVENKEVYVLVINPYMCVCELLYTTRTLLYWIVTIKKVILEFVP